MSQDLLVEEERVRTSCVKNNESDVNSARQILEAVNKDMAPPSPMHSPMGSKHSPKSTAHYPTTPLGLPKMKKTTVLDMIKKLDEDDDTFRIPLVELKTTKRKTHSMLDTTDQNRREESSQQMQSSKHGSSALDTIFSPCSVGNRSWLEREKFSHQKRLLLLRHAAKCTAKEGECKRIPYCHELKKLWNHITTNCADKNCAVAHCFTSRCILIHYSKCQDKKCISCEPVRQLIRSDCFQSAEEKIAEKWFKNNSINTNNFATVPPYSSSSLQNGVESSITTVTDDDKQVPVWFKERVYIQIHGKTGVIKEVHKSSVVVEFSNKTTRNVTANECTVISPKENDMVLVTGGEDIGLEGELVCIENIDAIILNLHGELKLVKLTHLAKVARCAWTVPTYGSSKSPTSNNTTPASPKYCPTPERKNSSLHYPDPPSLKPGIWIRHAEDYRQMALKRMKTKDYAAALEYYEKAIEMHERAYGTNEHPEISMTYIGIGFVYGNMGDYVKELEYYEKAIFIQEKADHPKLPKTYTVIASIYEKRNNYDEALKFYEKAREIEEKKVGSNSNLSLVGIYSKLGSVCDDMGVHDKAFYYLEKAGEIEVKKGEYDKGLKYYEKAREIEQKAICSDIEKVAAYCARYVASS